MLDTHDIRRIRRGKPRAAALSSVCCISLSLPFCKHNIHNNYVLFICLLETTFAPDKTCESFTFLIKKPRRRSFSFAPFEVTSTFCIFLLLSSTPVHRIVGSVQQIKSLGLHRGSYHYPPSLPFQGREQNGVSVSPKQKTRFSPIFQQHLSRRVDLICASTTFPLYHLCSLSFALYPKSLVGQHLLSPDLFPLD